MPSRLLTRFRWLLAVGSLALGAGGIWLMVRSARPGREQPSQGFGDRLFEAVFSRIRASSVDPLDDEELYRRAAEGVVEELDDPYAVLQLPRQPPLPPSDEPLPLGLFLDRRDGLIVVVATVPGSPADSAGVRAGDGVIAIDTVGLPASRLDRVPGLLAGRSGTTLVMRVRRDGSGALALSIRRGPVPAGPGVEAGPAGDGVGWLRLTRFGPGIDDSVRRAAWRLREQGSRSLVLDLRGAAQGGNDLAAAAAVADLFLERGTSLVTSRMRRASGSQTLTDSADSPFAAMPLAVLIDGGTAGAGEVIAGALQDHDRAVVLGSPSYGRGVSQNEFSLGGGAVLTLTTALWFTPRGRQIQRPPRPVTGDTLPRPIAQSDAGRPLVGGGGIVPDRILPERRDGADLVLAEARRLLARATTPENVFALLDRSRSPSR
ncbi:MAG: S41 family peptidase [Gemmatimonadales bacterium]